MKKTIRLGVNIDHVATLRQQRAGTVDYPNILLARDLVIKGGAEQITIHLRGDRRHIQEKDLLDLSEKRKGLLNLEMAATPEMLKIALRARPDYVCLVPEKREELTTEGGLDVAKNKMLLNGAVTELKKAGIKVSLFIEPQTNQIRASREVGADAVEFHTGQYALAKGAEQTRHLEHMGKACEQAHELGLHVHAGHGLDYSNVIGTLKLPFLEELNIGHSIVCRAVLVGLFEAVKEMKEVIFRHGS